LPEGPPLIFVVSPLLVRLPGRHATMADLASVMQRAALDYPVLDTTGFPQGMISIWSSHRTRPYSAGR